MALLGEIATLVFGRGGKIYGAGKEIVSGVLKGSRYIETPSRSLSCFTRDKKTWLNLYSVVERVPGKGYGVQTGAKGQLYKKTTRFYNGDINKSVLVDVGNGKYEHACVGFGHYFNKHGVKIDSNTIHSIELKARITQATNLNR